MFGYGFVNGRGRGGRAAVPAVIPPALMITNFTARSAVHNPPAALVDATVSDNPTGAATALQLTTSGSTDYYLTGAAALAQPLDVRNGHIQIPFKPISYCEMVLRWSIELHSAGTPAAPTGNYHRIDIGGDGPSGLKAILTSKAANAAAGRWQTFAAHPNDFLAVGTGADLSAIKFARLMVRGGASPMVIQFGSIRYQKAALSKAACIIYFDDGYPSAYSTALPLLSAKGWPACFNLGAMTANLDAPGRMSTAQVTALVAAGWQLHGQAYTSEDIAAMNAMTADQRNGEMQQQQAWAILRDLGDMRHGSYFSQVGPTEQGLFPMFRDNFRSVRTFNTARGAAPAMLFGESYPFADPMAMRALSGDSTLAMMQLHADQAIANNSVAAFVFHDNLTNLGPLLDWLDARRGQIEVTTEDRLYRRFHAAMSFKPEDMGDALFDDFDFEDVSTLSLTGNQINSITGKKTGLVLSQNLSASKPIWLPAGLNGRPCADFDGIDDGLVLSFTYAYVTGSAPLIVIALVDQKAPAADATIRAIFSTSGTVNSCRRLRRVQNAGVNRASLIIGTGAASSGVLGQNTPFEGVRIVQGNFGDTAASIAVDGVTGAATSIVPASTAGQLAIGTALVANQPFWGRINQILVINPLHPNWNLVNQAKLDRWIKRRGGKA